MRPERHSACTARMCRRFPSEVRSRSNVIVLISVTWLGNGSETSGTDFGVCYNAVKIRRQGTEGPFPLRAPLVSSQGRG
jgi:hypothetical protein